MSEFKTLHDAIAAYRNQDRRCDIAQQAANLALLRDRFCNFIFWDAKADEIDAVMRAISNAGFVSTGERPKVAGVKK